VRQDRPFLGQELVRKDAFTLGEITLTLAVIGLLLGVAVPVWAKSRNEARAKVCWTNLRVIASAKAQWKEESHKRAGDVPTAQDLAPYLHGRSMPVCPSRGVYLPGRLSQPPACSQHGRGQPLVSDPPVAEDLPD